MEKYPLLIQRLGYAAGVGEKDIKGAIDYAVSNGVNIVELNMNMPCFFPENYSLEERQKIKAYAAEQGVGLSIHAPEDISLLNLHDIVREAGIVRIKEVIHFGEDIGANRMTLHIGNSVCFSFTDHIQYMHEIIPERYKEILCQSLIELRSFAKGKIMICIENVGAFTQSVVQEVLDELLPQGGLYLTWDIGHSYGNKFKEDDFFRKHLDKIRNAHIHDHTGTRDHQVFGEGMIDFDYYFDLFKELDVNLIFEVRPREKAIESINRFREFNQTEEE